MFRIRRIFGLTPEELAPLALAVLTGAVTLLGLFFLARRRLKKREEERVRRILHERPPKWVWSCQSYILKFLVFLQYA